MAVRQKQVEEMSTEIFDGFKQAKLSNEEVAAVIELLGKNFQALAQENHANWMNKTTV
jgi:hypothetical protein